MSTSYTFDNISRIGDDRCFIDQNTIQNVASCSYMTQNYFGADCSMRNPIALATSQPGVMYKGGHLLGSGGCNVDQSTQLMYGSEWTRWKGHIDLYQRPFATVPFLGRGAVNPVVESQMLQGEQIFQRKSTDPTSEHSFLTYQTIPLLPEIEHHLTNPANYVEGVAHEGWIRGGLPSREVTRDGRR